MEFVMLVILNIILSDAQMNFFSSFNILMCIKK